MVPASGAQSTAMLLATEAFGEIFNSAHVLYRKTGVSGTCSKTG
jgi:hypothetical protein